MKLLLIVFLFALSARAEFQLRHVEYHGERYPYVVYAPADAEGPLPAILFLHGAGERGSDGWKQTTVGIGAEIRAKPSSYPAIVVMPQVPHGRNWSGAMVDVALLALEKAEQEFPVDSRRLYLTGISMGGNGAWNVANRAPRKFAAIAPLCGYGNPRDMAPEWNELPIWIFHGAEDKVVPPEHSREMYHALRERGARFVRYTEFSGMGHEIWDKVYADSEFQRWLFSYER